MRPLWYLKTNKKSISNVKSYRIILTIHTHVITTQFNLPCQTCCLFTTISHCEFRMLQQGGWQWQDGSSATYLKWANHFQFPTSYDLLRYNRPVTQPMGAGNSLTRHASKADGMCLAATVAADLSGVLLFPVDCKTNYTSLYVCLSSSARVQKITPLILPMGYHVELKQNVPIL